MTSPSDWYDFLKSNGNLILVFPDQVKYELHCKKTNQPINQCHVHANMGFDFMIDVINTINKMEYSKQNIFMLAAYNLCWVEESVLGAPVIKSYASNMLSG